MSRPESITSRERRARMVAERPPLHRAGRNVALGSGTKGRTTSQPLPEGSAEGRRIAGVAAGIAGFTGADPRTVRWLWLLSLPLSGGLTGLVYLLLWALIPVDPPEDRPPSPRVS